MIPDSVVELSRDRRRETPRARAARDAAQARRARRRRPPPPRRRRHPAARRAHDAPSGLRPGRVRRAARSRRGRPAPTDRTCRPPRPLRAACRRQPPPRRVPPLRRDRRRGLRRRARAVPGPQLDVRLLDRVRRGHLLGPVPQLQRRLNPPATALPPASQPCAEPPTGPARSARKEHRDEHPLHHEQLRSADRVRRPLAVRRRRRPDRPARRLPRREAGAVQPREGPRAHRARQGWRRVRHVHHHRGRERLHPRRTVPARGRDRDAQPVLDRRRRAGLPRHLAGSSRFRDNDMQWDFWSLSPESAHQVTWLMGDRGIPASWRTMDGFGSHTYQWINAAGEWFWVKYHFTTNQGIKNFTGDEAAQLAGSDADVHIRDLHDAIERGEFPSWTLSIQVMPYEDAATYRFNPFDLTKVWPHADYPLIKVGTLELNRNPTNYFAQIEEAAFAPSNFVPGIAASHDKMLLARIFSYADAHRYRVGTNYQQLPVNTPHAAPVHSFSKDGAARYTFDAPSVPVYAPSSVGGPVADPARAAESAGWESDGELQRSAATLHPEDDDFGQAGTLYRTVFDDAARARLLETITGHVGAVTSPTIRDRAIWYWTSVDAGLGAALHTNLAGSTPIETGEPSTSSVPIA